MKIELDKNNIPNHVAIIMDGNGRWAKKKGFLRALGHENGANTVRKIVQASTELGVSYLTLYAFSTENWNRPKLEVDTLMSLLVKSLKKELKTFIENDIKFNVIGRMEGLPKAVQKELKRVLNETKDNKKLVLSLALNYGSREEIRNCIIEISDKVKNSLISPDEIDDKLISDHLYTRNIPDVDLLIRTSGEQRISNFLLWQIAYSELFFTEVLWPDFTKEHLKEAILNYQNRERRFGKTSEQIKN